MHISVLIWIISHLIYVMSQQDACQRKQTRIQIPVLSFPPRGLYSLKGRTSYHKISWSLEAARFSVRLLRSLWNLTGVSEALLPVKFQSDMIIITPNHAAPRLREFGGKTSYRVVNRGPGGLPPYSSSLFSKLWLTETSLTVNIPNSAARLPKLFNQ